MKKLLTTIFLSVFLIKITTAQEETKEKGIEIS